MTKQIELTQGKHALVDDDDYAELSKYYWYAVAPNPNRDTVQVYAARKGSRKEGRKTIYMHRVIMGNPPRGMEVDHINGNGLDNRRDNLRLATRRQNAANSSLYGNNKSGYRGVRFHHGVWYAQLGGATRHIGTFPTAEEAARAYDAAARERWGAFARLNFPLDSGAKS